MYNNQTNTIIPNTIAYVSNKRNLDQNTKELDSQTPIKKFISNFKNIVHEYTGKSINE